MKKTNMKMALTRFAAAALAAAMLLGVMFVPVTAKASNKYEGTPYVVCVTDGYLALRNDTKYDAKNEIGSLFTGETVYVQWKANSTYSYAYSPKLDKYGYVNHNYLVAKSKVYDGKTYTAKVDSGYLALRKEAAYDINNEVGKLYSGYTVTLMDKTDSTYWLVYSADLGKYGLVNSNFLK